MYAKACFALLVFFIMLITLQNAPYLAHGYMLHAAPMLALCLLAYAILRADGPPATSRVFWALAVVAATSVALELGFAMYKRKPFDENGVVTLTSFAQLLSSSFVSFAIWRRRKNAGRFRLTDKSSIWLIIALGFLYLAADEEILLHEGAGHAVNKIFGLGEVGLWAHLDDMLVGLYGVVGVAALWLYRRELLLFPACVRLLAVGFVFLVLSVAADAASHRPDFFVGLLGPQRGMTAYNLGEDVDELAKLISEMFFLTGFSSGLRVARGRTGAAAGKKAAA
ncbi:MAG: hypothetical protein AUJ49_10780 [Desulfovibrionaceae bacterium CG1_02_65_16]|nr:MAG: hypothetical protein AUJ49_10780 [Desulfovibrionaceae bacterium CG1_02_65_16]